MQRILIVGTSGSGKSTLARVLSERFSLPHIDLDLLLWQENWSQCPKDLFREKVSKAAESESWIIDGNYGSVRDITWKRATTMIWLDYPFYLAFYRAFKRALKRIHNKEMVCGRNYESYKRLFSKDSILLWIINSHWRRKKEYARIIQQPEYQHLKIIRLTSPKETKFWFQMLIA